MLASNNCANNSTNPWHFARIAKPTLLWGISLRGREHCCKFCNLILLTGEKDGFCCGPNGKFFDIANMLPPLPPSFDIFINHRDVSFLSRRLNVLFAFASLGCTKKFPNPMPPSFVAIAGRCYRYLRSKDTDNSAIRWILYDGFENSEIHHPHLAASIPQIWIDAVRSTLLQCNPFTRRLHFLHQLQVSQPDYYRNASLILEDAGTREVAAILSYSNSTAQEVLPRQLSISLKDGSHQKLSTISPMWEPLAYPLFFPYGTLGWGVRDNSSNSSNSPNVLSQIWHYRFWLLHEYRFQIFGRLTNEYVVDMFTRHLECRLNYIHLNLSRIREQEEDAALMGRDEITDQENVYLPSSFLGSSLWCSNQIRDSLAIAAKFGAPTFFITFTCNAKWPEIQSQLRPGQDYSDIPTVVCRVFKQKLAKLMQTLRKLFPHSGGVAYEIHCIEFQKRGLPHAHILIKYHSNCLTADAIDSVISARIPQNAQDAALVRSFMIHNTHYDTLRHVPPSDEHPLRYCERWINGSRKCRFNYPKPVREVTAIDDHGYTHYARPNPGDEYVVPHCLPLLRSFECHINVEIASSSQLFQYLFKYIHKGPDFVRYCISLSASNQEPVNEFDEYWNGRYLSASEATWRLLGFHLTRKDPAVTPLPIHMPFDVYHRQFRRNSDVPSSSKLAHYFYRPLHSFLQNNVTRNFDDLRYSDYFTLFRLQSFDPSKNHLPNFFREHPSSPTYDTTHVVQRKPPISHICRLQNVRLYRGEVFYLRVLLQNRPARSYESLRTINEICHSSFQEACLALGLFADENEADYCLTEAINMLQTPPQLRLLFTHLLIHDCIIVPLRSWNRFKVSLSTDYLLDLNGMPHIAHMKALEDISRLLEDSGRGLADFGLPIPSIPPNELLHEIARWAPISSSLSSESFVAIQSFNEKQLEIFNQITSAIQSNTPLLLFIDGKAGRGKTFLVNALCNSIRSSGHIVLATATSAFAAQLYPGGRTVHSTFKVPIDSNNEFLSSPIDIHHARGRLINAAKLIIWDEAPMANKAVLSCVEEVCRKVSSNNLIFGGKVVVLLGDFRQTCPVIRRGTRVQIVEASIRTSPLWSFFTIQSLTTPIRNAEDPIFASAVDDIGDGTSNVVDLSILRITYSLDDFIDFAFPPSLLPNPILCIKRSILAPTNQQVDLYNQVILAKLTGAEKTYYAADHLEEHDNTEDDFDHETSLPTPDAILDYVASQRPPGMPDYALTIKLGAVYRLLRNFSIERDLGTRLITVKLIRSSSTYLPFDDDCILLPRITFKEVLRSGHTLIRRQFPLAPAYATTFHSCQGLTLDRIAVDLTSPVFTHGQLYTALSRIRNRDHGIVRLPIDETCTTNVTYHEILL